MNQNNKTTFAESEIAQLTTRKLTSQCCLFCPAIPRNFPVPLLRYFVSIYMTETGKMWIGCYEM
jgi:hypothetical protein